jgi:hypothetical protein
MTYGLEGRCSIQLSYWREVHPVGAVRFELTTSCSQSRRANRAAPRPALADELIEIGEDGQEPPGWLVERSGGPERGG